MERIENLEKNISLLREQLHAMEQVRIKAPTEERMRIKQRIETEIKPEIKKYEIEYWQVVASCSQSIDVSENQAEIIIGEIVEEVGAIEGSNLLEYSDEVVANLREIKDELTQQNKPAAAPPSCSTSGASDWAVSRSSAALTCVSTPLSLW